MPHVVGIMLLILMLVAPAQAQVLRDERVLFPAAALLAEGHNPHWVVRISPDGRRLLYTKPLGDAAPADRGPQQYQLILRQLDTGVETTMPIPPLDRGFQTVFTRINLFDPPGKRMALMHIPPAAQGQRQDSEIVLYDLESKQLTPTNLKGPMTFGRFNRTGDRLIVSDMQSASLASLPDLKVTKLSAPGWVHSASPTSDLVTIHAREARPREAPGAPPTTRPRSMRLLLWDIAADKRVVELPTHERNTSLDDAEAQWTADGRYVAYLDFESEAANPQPLRPMGRVWDTKESRLVASIHDATPIGSLGGTRIAMSRRRDAGPDAVVIDCAKPQDVRPLQGGAPIDLVHAVGDQVVYIKESGGARTFMIARVAEK